MKYLSIYKHNTYNKLLILREKSKINKYAWIHDSFYIWFNYAKLFSLILTYQGVA